MARPAEIWNGIRRRYLSAAIFTLYLLLFHLFRTLTLPQRFCPWQSSSKKLLDMCPYVNEREFTHMRYSVTTCDLFIVYNEDEELFCGTMHGVIKNIAHLYKRGRRSKTWGWEKVVVCFVSDGRENQFNCSYGRLSGFAKVSERILSICLSYPILKSGRHIRKPEARVTYLWIYQSKLAFNIQCLSLYSIAKW